MSVSKGRKLRTTIGGKKVVNGSRRITLHISGHDARTGASKAPGSCAAAKAAMREIPNCTQARIHIGRAYIFDKTKDHWLRYKTTDALRSEIVAFDRGGKFEPGDYDLKPLAPSDLVPKRQAKTYPSLGNSQSSKKKSPRRLHVIKGVRNRPRKSD